MDPGCRVTETDEQEDPSMKVGMVALHYPRREHWDEMITRVRHAADVMAATPGCLTTGERLSRSSSRQLNGSAG
jgi:hypothetical protein